MRLIQIFSDIDQNMSSAVIKQMLDFANADSSPITILLNTNGGQVIHAFAITQMMELLPVPVQTFGIGAVHSAGLIILSAGKHRMVTKDCLLMAHEHHFGIPDMPYSDHVAQRQHHDDIYNRMVAHFVSHSKLLQAEVKQQIMGDDHYFDSFTALKMGIVDEVLEKWPVEN